MNLTGASQFFGASVSDEIVITGNYKYHYDEALAGSALKYAVTGWDEI